MGRTTRRIWRYDKPSSQNTWLRLMTCQHQICIKCIKRSNVEVHIKPNWSFSNEFMELEKWRRMQKKGRRKGFHTLTWGKFYPGNPKTPNPNPAVHNPIHSSTQYTIPMYTFYPLSLSIPLSQTNPL